MDNYKIKVKDEAASKEAQELFVQLGYSNRQSKRFGFVYTQNGEIGCDSMKHWDYYNDLCQELTLPQLRDLVVLKRNDVKDANHRDKRDESIYLTSDKVIYYWQGEWCKSAINKSNDYENYIANSLTPITQPQDPALISGAEALRALADGKEVEYWEEYKKAEFPQLPEWVDVLNTVDWDIKNDVLSGKTKFRLKPQTIKLELELPKPFEPKEGDTFYYLNDGEEYGFVKCEHDWTFDPKELNFGAYRTEDEIKQLVEQLRKIRGAS
ncbi:hypothetical protein [Acinetobacter baumannii]|uniref:hypothetical protein n=1 Tax=Acinetobacter baumannii TaxID=470 RepID=UPI00112B5DDF|nr:hypothetical protein [Acinetobacter baumannii]EHU2133747.1 hypothetical protein [Acinetobacter baumannii]TPR75242.1 hypothetical protein FJU89_02855 [Acinetobacter baumannii]